MASKPVRFMVAGKRPPKVESKKRPVSGDLPATQARPLPPSKVRASVSDTGSTRLEPVVTSTKRIRPPYPRMARPILVRMEAGYNASHGRSARRRAGPGHGAGRDRRGGLLQGALGRAPGGAGLRPPPGLHLLPPAGGRPDDSPARDRAARG